MLGVALFLVLAAVGATVVPSVLRLDDEHALAGLFGDPERERVIARRAIALLASAESVVRLATFDEALRGKAWAGVPLVMSRVSARWSEWAFADGSRWLVRHRGRPPKHLQRVIVADATTTEGGLAVDAYGPGCGCAEAILEITDAAELVTSGAAASSWGAGQRPS